MEMSNLREQLEKIKNENASLEENKKTLEIQKTDMESEILNLKSELQKNIKTQERNNRNDNELMNLSRRQQEKLNTINTMLQSKNNDIQIQITKLSERFQEMSKEFSIIRNDANKINSNLNNSDFIEVEDLISTL